MRNIDGPIGPLRSHAPKYPPKVQTPDTSLTSPTARGVIAMVDDVNNPTTATIYINNELPAEDGYKIPTDLGVKFQMAPNPVTTPAAGIAYFNNTTTLTGGSWCTVDQINRKIIHVEQGVSNQAPEDPSQLFQYIQHNGAYNTTGNFTNPGPIDTTQVAVGALGITPVATNAGTFSVSASGSGTTDFTNSSFTLNSVGTTASTWLVAIYLVASIAGQNKWGLYGTISPNASGTYSGTWGGLGSGNLNYDLGIAYLDLSGKVSNVATLATNQVPNSITAAIGRLPATAPAFSVTPANVVYTALNPNSYSVTIPFTATNQSSMTNATGISVWCNVTGQPSNKISLGTLALNSGGSYSVTIPNASNGTQTYDIWAAFIDGSGNPGTATNFFTTTAFTSAPAGSGGTMPSNTTASATFVSEVNLNTWTNPYLIELNFTLAAGQTTATWLRNVEMIYQPTNFSFLTSNANSGATTITVNWPFSVGVSNGNSITISGGGNTETKTISSIGTPSAGVAGTQTCVLTLSSGLTNSYNAYSTVTGPLGTVWTPCGLLPPNSGGSYTGVWSCPPYSSLAVRLIDYGGNPSNPSSVLYSVVALRHLLGSSPAAGASGYTPVVTSTSGITYNNAGNGAYDAVETVTFDANGTTQNQWLVAVEQVVSTKNLTSTLNGAVSANATTVTLTSASGAAIGDQLTLDTGSNIEYAEITNVSGNVLTLAKGLQLAHSNGVSTTINTWKHYGYQAVQAANAYPLTWVALGAGSVYQLGVRLEDQSGNVSYAVNVGATAANPIANTAMQTMPSAIKTNGPTITSSSLGTMTRRGGIIQSRIFTFTESDFTSSIPSWIDNIIVTVRINGDTDGARQIFIDPRASTTGTYTKAILFTLGDTVDIGVSYEDVSGQVSAINWCVTSQSDPDGAWTDGGGKALLGRHSPGVQATITDTTDSFGSNVKPGRLHRLHLEQSGQPGGTNLIYNPTFANGLTGWTKQGGSSSVMSWTPDTFGGGRLIGSGGTLAAGAFESWLSTPISVFANQPMVLSGIVEINPTGGADVRYHVGVTDSGVTTTIIDGNWAPQAATRIPFAFPLNSGAFTSVVVRVYAINSSGSTAEAAGTVIFQKLQLEYGTQPSPFVDHIGSYHGNNLAVSTLQKNLVLNGNNCNGAGSIAPSVYGWTRNNLLSSVVSAGTYTLNGQNFSSIQVNPSGIGGWSGQTIPVVPGQTYTFCALLWCPSTAGAGARLWIGDAGTTTQWNTSPGKPVGVTGQFYSAATSFLNAADAPANGNWTCVYGTFTVPSGNSQCSVLIQSSGLSNAATVYGHAVQIIQGNRLQDYIDHEPNLSFLDKSAVIARQLPNSTAFVSDFTIQYNYTFNGVGNTNAMTIGYSSSSGTSNDATIWMPDGSTQYNAGHNASAYTDNASNYTTNTNKDVYYVYAYYTPGSGMTFQVQKNTPFSISTVKGAYADGGFIVAQATASAAAVASASNVSGSGSVSPTGMRARN